MQEQEFFTVAKSPRLLKVSPRHYQPSFRERTRCD